MLCPSGGEKLNMPSCIGDPLPDPSRNVGKTEISGLIFIPSNSAF